MIWLCVHFLIGYIFFVRNASDAIMVECLNTEVLPDNNVNRLLVYLVVLVFWPLLLLYVIFY